MAQDINKTLCSRGKMVTIQTFTQKLLKTKGSSLVVVVIYL